MANIKVNGIVSVAPHNLATVCMPLGGFVKITTLVPGNRVVRGQTLAVIENQDFVDIQQNYLETRTISYMQKRNTNVIQSCIRRMYIQEECSAGYCGIQEPKGKGKST